MTQVARILVVDDEDIVRRVIVTWLMRWGHTVAEADSADGGLAIMEASPAEIVIVDLMMPTHSGLWLIERIRERWPSTPIIVESGAHDDAKIESAKRYGVIAFVPKPFGREMFHQAIEQAVHNLSKH